jgi:hypothetical protein
MTDYQKQIRRINMLQKILDQELVSLKKSFADEEALEQINHEIKEFVSKLLDEALGNSTPASSQFTEAEVSILKRFAEHAASKAKAKPPEAKPSVPKTSPVLEALREQGIDPSTASPEQVKDAVKAQERENIHGR